MLIYHQQSKDLVNTIKSIYHKKDYTLFTNIQQINLIFLRHNLDIPQKYSDTGILLWQNLYSNWKFFYFECTTTPGKYYRLNPINSLGTGIIVPGQYVNLYSQGKHKGRNALIQSSPLPVYRDNNKDLIIDKNKTIIAQPSSGFNCHGANQNLQFTKQVGKWSAGCFVIPNKYSYQFILNMCYASMNKYKEKMSMTLLEEQDFNIF